MYTLFWGKNRVDALRAHCDLVEVCYISSSPNFTFEKEKGHDVCNEDSVVGLYQFFNNVNE